MKAALLLLLCLNTVAACGTHLYYVEYPEQWPPIKRADVPPRDETRALRIAIIGPDKIDGIDFIVGPHSIATELALAGYQAKFYDNTIGTEAIEEDAGYTLIVRYEHEPGQRAPDEGYGILYGILTLGLLPVFAKEFDYINLKIFAPGREGRHFIIRYVKDTMYGTIPWLYRTLLYKKVYSGCIFARNLQDTRLERSTSGMNIQIANLIVSEGLRTLAESPAAAQESD